VGDGKPVRAYCGYRNAVNWHIAHPDFRGNRSSIGVELACDKADRRSKRAEDTDWTITPETLATAAELCAWLCREYDIPVANILRHYDCAGKPCPRPLVGDDINEYYGISGNERWAQFKQQIQEKLK
jgi:N-acetylmuramoyl-L-alanine amidase CwlA